MTAEPVSDVVTQPEIRLWPGVAPGSEGATYREKTSIHPEHGWFLYHNVVDPTLTPVMPEPHRATSTAVIVAPGGAYAALAWDHEGLETARWLAERGITAFVLKYRLLGDVGPEVLAEAPPMSDRDAFFAWMREKTAPIRALARSDGEQAVRVVRARAAEWSIDPSRVGILGFSAGGSVALNAAVTSDPEARPDFVVPIYSAFADGPVPSGAPPLFGVVAADDPLGAHLVETSREWMAAGNATELHLYEQGGHGFGVTPQGLPVDTWPDRFAEWLMSRDLLPDPGMS